MKYKLRRFERTYTEEELKAIFRTVTSIVHGDICDKAYEKWKQRAIDNGEVIELDNIER